MTKLPVWFYSFLLILFLLSGQLRGQDSSDKDEMLERLRNMQTNQKDLGQDYYETPRIYDDSSYLDSVGGMIHKKRQDYLTPQEKIEESSTSDTTEQWKQAKQPDQVIPKPGPDRLELFGARLFSGDVSNFAPAPISTVPPDYKLGPGDNLIVHMWGRVDLEMNLTVDREGKIFIPKAGEIAAFNLTLDQFKERLKNRLRSIYSDFELGVTLGKIRTIRVYIYGEAKKPGGYTLSSLSTLLNALYNCGGPGQNGSMRNIRLIRSGEVIATVDLYEFLLNGNTQDNLKLQSEDVIFVPIVGPRVKLRGEVKRPAIYEIKGGETLLDAIQLAGGPDDEAFLGRVMVDRIVEGKSRELLDLSLATLEDLRKNDIAIQAGDDISVFGIYERRDNVIWLTGHVKHPGAYQVQEQQTISSLLASGNELKEETYMARADLIRTHSDGSKELIPFNLEKAINADSLHNHLLQANDSLRIYGSWEVVREKFVQIEGEVHKQGEYKLYDNMRISDLIFMAGGLNRSAYMLTAEVARRAPGAKTEIIYVDLEDIYINDDHTSDIELQEYDQVFIRRVPHWDLDNFVTITGEVRFPGEYVLHEEDETLYDLIMRSGGLTSDAFAFGTVFIRGEIQNKLELMNLSNILDRSNPIRFDSVGNPNRTAILEYNPKELSRMVIDLDLILKSRGTQGDIILQKGDEIYIPPLPSGVQVTGAVASSGTIQYMSDKKASYYVDRAGGYLPHADKDQLRVIRANGQVVPRGKAGGYKIGLGDVVMVPSKIIKEKSVGQTILTSVSIISSIATTIFILDRL